MWSGKELELLGRRNAVIAQSVHLYTQNIPIFHRHRRQSILADLQGLPHLLHRLASRPQSQSLRIREAAQRWRAVLQHQ